MGIADIHEAESRLSKLVERSMNGEVVIIAKAGRPMVRPVPVHGDDSPREGGRWKGRVRIADDFDTLPDDIAAAFGIHEQMCHFGASRLGSGQVDAEIREVDPLGVNIGRQLACGLGLPECLANSLFKRPLNQAGRERTRSDVEASGGEGESVSHGKLA